MPPLVSRCLVLSQGIRRIHLTIDLVRLHLGIIRRNLDARVKVVWLELIVLGSLNLVRIWS